MATENDVGTSDTCAAEVAGGALFTNDSRPCAGAKINTAAPSKVGTATRAMSMNGSHVLGGGSLTGC